MSDAKAIAEHWGRGDVYALILAALKKMSKPLEGLTLEDLAPVDHFHARGFTATVELADRLPIKPGQHVLDIGCGLGGPARYMAKRFNCHVSGVDITEPFVQAGNKLSALLGMEDRVTIEQGDGQRLPYPDARFDGAYTQHVTMNVADRPAFFSEAFAFLSRAPSLRSRSMGSGRKAICITRFRGPRTAAANISSRHRKLERCCRVPGSRTSTSTTRARDTLRATGCRSRRQKKAACRRSGSTS